MYSFLLGLQYLGIIAILCGLGAAYYTRKSEFQTVVLMVFACNLISQFGYIFEMQATNLESALVGIKLAYYGKLCVIFFILYFTFLYCGVKLHRAWVVILNLVHLGIFISIWTCEKNTLYYKTMEFVDWGIYPHLEITPGITHYAFDLLLVAYMIAILIVCIRKLCISKSKIERRRVLCLLLVPIVIALSYVIFKSGVVGCFDTTSVALLIDTLIMLYALRKLEIINYVAKAKEEIVDEIPDGILVLNESEQLVYYNAQAGEIFEEVKNSDGSNVVEKVSNNYNRAEEIWIEDKLYHIRKKEIKEDDRVKSSIYTLTDNTSNYILTYVDGLTNVKNRRALIQAMEQIEPDEDLWMVIIDIDDFKGINDTMGHPIGDLCLVRFANTLLEMFGRDAIYRYGGDEFVIIVKENYSKLERKLLILNGKLSDDSNDYPFHVSGGYIRIEKGVELEELMKTADDALYEVKKSGKGKFVRATV